MIYTADPAHVLFNFIVYINPARPGNNKSLLSKVMQKFYYHHMLLYRMY